MENATPGVAIYLSVLHTSFAAHQLSSYGHWHESKSHSFTHYIPNDICNGTHEAIPYIIV